MKIDKTEYSYQVTECDLKFGEQITLNGELLVPVSVFDKIRSEIMNCLKALDEIEKSGLNIYLPNEISGRRLTYKQCLEFIDKHKAESE